MQRQRQSSSRRASILSEEEWLLWAHVADQVKPLPGKSRPVRPVVAKPKDEPAPTAPHTKAVLSAPRAAPSPPPLAAIEPRLRTQVQRGQRAPDGILDLHGYRQDEAHRRLLEFLHRKRAQGAKLVIVITGKGQTGGGVLKRLVPLWLAESHLRGLVIGFEDAAQHHGGSGALYVRLRRPTAKD
jgi:DNA-nicking Smr family endonuclease